MATAAKKTAKKTSAKQAAGTPDSPWTHTTPAGGSEFLAWRDPSLGWYGLRKGYRGRFGMYVPMVLAKLGLIEVENKPRNNRARAL